MHPALLQSAGHQAAMQAALHSHYIRQQQTHYQIVHDAARQHSMNAALLVAAGQVPNKTPVEVVEAVKQLGTQLPTAPDGRAVREMIFAFCDTNEFAPQSQTIKREIGSHPEFDKLAIHEQLMLLFRINQECLAAAESNHAAIDRLKQSQINGFYWGMVQNVLAGWIALLPAQWQVPMVAMLVLLGLIPSADMGHRQPDTGKYPELGSRVSVHTCDVYQSPRPNAARTGTMPKGVEVVIERRQAEWRHVHYLDGNRWKCGWVKSKYLRQRRS